MRLFFLLLVYFCAPSSFGVLVSEGDEMLPALPVVRGAVWDRLHERLGQQRAQPGQVFREAMEHVIQQHPEIEDAIAAYTELLMDHMLYLKTKNTMTSLFFEYYRRESIRLKGEITHLKRQLRRSIVAFGKKCAPTSQRVSLPR